MENLKERMDSYLVLHPYYKTLLEELGLEITPKNLKVLSRYEVAEKIDPSKFDKLVEEYINIFPRGIKSGGYSVRDSKAGCSKKLKNFIKKNKKYSFDVILQATKNYVARSKENDYQYMTLASYFIEKNGSSKLEGECEEIVNGTFKVRSTEIRL